MVKLFIINDLCLKAVVLSKPWVGGSSPPGRAKKRLYIKSLQALFLCLKFGLQKGCKKVAKPKPKKRPLIKAAQGETKRLCLEFSQAKPV